MFNGKPNCEAASHPVPKFDIKDCSDGGFQKWGYPQSSSIFDWDFPISHPFLGSPMAMEPPRYQVAPVDQRLSLKVMKLFLKGLDLIGAWAVNRIAMLPSQNRHYVERHIQSYSLIVEVLPEIGIDI